MRTHYNPKNNPRVIIIQKLYGKFYNEDDDLDFPKHRFKKFAIKFLYDDYPWIIFCAKVRFHF